MTILASVHRVAPYNTTTDHAVYFSYALDTWGGILIDNLTVVATDAAGLRPRSTWITGTRRTWRPTASPCGT